MHRHPIGPALLGLVASAIVMAFPDSPLKEFTIDDAWGRDTVEFRSSAFLEEIVGTTNRVHGFLRADPAHLTAGNAAARVEVPLASLKTGVAMRDGAVARALGAAEHPAAVFTLEHVRVTSSEALVPNVPAEIAAEGFLELHGVKRTVAVQARITYIPKGGPFNQMRPGNFVKLVAVFDVALADYGIDRTGPVLPLQVAPQARVTVSVLATDASPAETSEYRRQAEKYLGKAVQ